MTPIHLSRWTKCLIHAAGNAIALTGRGNRLCVVNYHRILSEPDVMLDSEPDLATFTWQMELLARCFNVIGLDQALRALDAGTLPARALAITFDDGYRSVHDLALPVLKKFGLPATVFVTSGHVGKGNMWNDRIIHAVQTLPPEALDLTDIGLAEYSLGSLQERSRTAERLVEQSKYMPPPERDALVLRLAALSGLSHDDLMLTPDMLLALDRNGITIGAHTISHPILTSLNEASARHEISGGREQLEALLNKPVRLFAYPNGKVNQDYDTRHVQMVREAGFDAAFTTAVGAITADQDRYQLPRSRPWDSTPLRFGLRLLSWMASSPRQPR